MSTTSTATRTSATSFLARRPVWQVSYLSGLAASVAVEVWGLAARAAGVPMRAAGFGSQHATGDHGRHVRDEHDGRHVLVHVRRHPHGPFRGEPQAHLPANGAANTVRLAT